MTRRRPNPSTGMDCRAVGRLLQAFLDGEVGDGWATAVAEHLDACLDCGIEADAYRWLKAVLAGIARADDSRQLQRLHAFADALVEQGQG